MDSALKFWLLYLRTTNLPELFLSELIPDFFLLNIPSCVLTDMAQAFSQLCTCVEEGELTVEEEERSEERRREMKSGGEK